MIPEQLAGTQFIKLAHEAQNPVHEDGSKGPKYHRKEDELLTWLDEGGNVGRVFNDSLIAIDVDQEEFLSVIYSELPEKTFTVQTASGRHLYYRCPTWEISRSFTDDDGEETISIRNGNQYTVVPPSVHPSGCFYEVEKQEDVAEVSEAQIRSVIEKVAGDEGKNRQHTAARGACVGRDNIGIPSEYPSEDVSWETMRKWLSANSLLSVFNKRHLPNDRSGRDFVVAKCLAEGGFSEGSIREAMSRLPSNSKWKKREEDYREMTVRKAIHSAVEDDYVSFDDTGYSDDVLSEGRGSTEDRYLPEGVSMSDSPDFTTKEEVTVLEGTEEGHNFKSVALVEGSTEDETWEYVSMRRGRVEEAETVEGDTVLAKNVQEQNSLGVSPENIPDLVDALEELHEQIEE